MKAGASQVAAQEVPIDIGYETGAHEAIKVDEGDEEIS